MHNVFGKLSIFTGCLVTTIHIMSSLASDKREWDVSSYYEFVNRHLTQMG